MSQPRRRRRRRRRRTGSVPPEEKPQAAEGRSREQADGRGQPSSSRSRRRRRRRGPRRAPRSPETLEEIERSIKPELPPTLTAPPDGQTLEELIGDLQSVWGVPQYPQEYRITLKVAEERGATPPPVEVGEDGVQREKAPAAPRVGPSPPTDSSAKPKREKAPRRRRGSRRGRRRRSGET
jgi:hypothetical protein